MAGINTERETVHLSYPFKEELVRGFLNVVIARLQKRDDEDIAKCWRDTNGRLELINASLEKRLRATK